MQKQNGFTLIELVVVIIILGILAVTAAPKFINLQSDARASALQGVKGAIQGANGLVFAKSALAGDEKKVGSSWVGDTGVDIGAENLAKTNFGYLQATLAEFNNAIDADFGLSTTDPLPEWVVVANGGTPATMTIKQAGSPADNCQLVYTEAESTSVVPTYLITDTGC
ncbi:type II secretion system protein [uncultured Shewanella sp.]|uniref:type II secretion system protein n=1 Tax=uncultured Shewanella sp. TaxID=173975 RepID=UPI00261AF2A8|nr:type II secretion system protein [uncultured Shewanella sp.]